MIQKEGDDKEEVAHHIKRKVDSSRGQPQERYMTGMSC